MKKGSFAIDSMPLYMVMMILIGIMFVIFVFVFSSTSNTYYKFPEGVESYIVEQQFFSCFNIEGKRVFNWDMFNQTTFESCIPHSKDAYKLRLQFAGEEKIVATADWDETKNVLRGKTIDVNVKRNDAVQDGKLMVEVQS